MTTVSIRTIRIGFPLMAVMLCARVAAAQYHVESWTTENGLPQNVVGAIHQTRDGYIWLATRDGLVRFDGVRFTVFDRNNSPGIRNNRFTVLYEAADGAIWAGTEGGGVTRYANGTFATYTTQDGLPNNQVYGVTGDAAGHVWVVSGGRIMQWDGTRFGPASTNGVTAPFYASEWNPQVFWAIDPDGLHRFERGEFSVRALPPALHGLSNNRFEEDADGTLWMGTVDRPDREDSRQRRSLRCDPRSPSGRWPAGLGVSGPKRTRVAADRQSLVGSVLVVAGEARAAARHAIGARGSRRQPLARRRWQGALSHSPTTCHRLLARAGAHRSQHLPRLYGSLGKRVDGGVAVRPEPHHERSRPELHRDRRPRLGVCHEPGRGSARAFVGRRKRRSQRRTPRPRRRPVQGSGARRSYRRARTCTQSCTIAPAPCGWERTSALRVIRTAPSRC